LQEGRNFKIKRIEVKPGASLSLQMHHHRSEHWVVVSGTGKVTVEDKVCCLAPKRVHVRAARREAPPGESGQVTLTLIEVASCRRLCRRRRHRALHDVYGRAPAAVDKSRAA